MFSGVFQVNLSLQAIFSSFALFLSEKQKIEVT
jgi:hypothetical protein